MVLDPYSIDWSQITRDNFNFKIRQLPGDQNALGKIKFMFPNQFSVYMHDTPSKDLFDKTVRSFSHGCIRVQYPRKFASVLLKSDPRWTPERIDEKIDARDRSVYRLPRSVPVHLSYLTAWVNKDGTVHFRDDIYGRDERLALALQRSRVLPM